LGSKDKDDSDDVTVFSVADTDIGKKVVAMVVVTKSMTNAVHRDGTVLVGLLLGWNCCDRILSLLLL